MKKTFLPKTIRWTFYSGFVFLIIMSLLRFVFANYFSAPASADNNLTSSYILGFRYDLRYVTIVMMITLLFSYIKPFNPIILSAPSQEESSRIGKRVWKKNNLPDAKMILTPAKFKQKYAGENKILIDDMERNIQQWRDKGGIGILHTSAVDTIKQLKELGL